MPPPPAPTRALFLAPLVAGLLGVPACARVDDRTPSVGTAGSNAGASSAGNSAAGTSSAGGASGTGGASGGNAGSGNAGSGNDSSAAGQGGNAVNEGEAEACGGSALVNAGFEQDTEGWTLFSSGPDPVIYEETDPQNVEFGVPAYEGERLAWLGGAASLTERLTQPFTLPATASNLNLAFFYRVRTNNVSDMPQDRASVSLAVGTESVASLLELDNTSGTSDGWQAFATVIDVSAYAGSTLTLVIEGAQQTDGTNFFFDGLQTTVECTP